jgi:hypothetical protein
MSIRELPPTTEIRSRSKKGAGHFCVEFAAGCQESGLHPDDQSDMPVLSPVSFRAMSVQHVRIN